MTAIVEDETLQMYIEESKEHLDTIESDLLAIEQQGENIDEALVNKVFRAAHSIKGGAGFLGLNTIKELAHKIENVLDMIRNYQMVPIPDVVNIILVAFDFLGELLNDAVHSGDKDISSHVEALQALATANLNAEEKRLATQTEEILADDLLTTFTLTDFDLNQARRGGKNVYILKFDLIRDVQRKNQTPFALMMQLDSLGLVLDLKIGIASVGDLDSAEISSAIPMYVLYASAIEEDLIGTVLDLDKEDIRLISIVERAESNGQGEPELHDAVDSMEVSMGEPPEQKEVDHQLQEEIRPEKRAVVQESDSQFGKKPLSTKVKSAESGADSLRVSVGVLDQLMNRAGELVLARNQLLQALSQGDRQSVKVAGQRISLVTSELQETIMLTRMQPVGNIFNKFPRLVRDLARSLGKEMELSLEGNEVEMDKTIIEGLGDPLTHLVRNSADHGIEMPDHRKDHGKSISGRIVLRAFHESGQVIIEIEDDGKGLDTDKLAAKALEKGIINEQQLDAMTDAEKMNLIMLPGFSTAEKVTDVSGRGVGMDVVKTNLDKLGGQVEIQSQVGKGTVVRIKLPLTLAIIPSLLVSSCGQRFALPQVNVGELLRIPANQIREKIDKVGGADVLTLRGELIPLLQLNNVLGLQQTYFDAKLGVIREDRRQRLIDDRLINQEGESVSPSPVAKEEHSVGLEMPERRGSRSSDICIVVLQTGAFKYGMVVNEVHDTIEIVVKPLGRHLKNCDVYAGATIMGDGRVSLILDVAGLARHADLRSLSDAEKKAHQELKGASEESTRQSLLLFRNGAEEHCAVPLRLVLRVEQIKTSDIEIKGGKKVIQYRGGSLPVFALEEVASVEMLEESDKLAVLLFVIGGHEVGLLAVPPLDVIEVDLVVDESTLRQTGISGSAIIQGKTTLLVNIFEVIYALKPDWQQHDTTITNSAGGAAASSILLVEDSQFFRSQVKHFIEDAGYRVIEAEDGVEAWAILEKRATEIGLVITDIEMPNMNGFELTFKIKNDPRFSHLEVIALTSLAGEEDVAKGKKVGIDEYQVKLDRDNLIQSVAARMPR
ncbi:MAG: chemotaxis protein CheW [Proteobacteria bacterium]|nr:response regulator [Desulfobulbaceae bacterium]MBU4154321.1 chemotaxis protein CheW [Pseudomonadota bacterium]